MKFKTLLLWRPKPRHLKSDEEEKAGNSIFLKGEVLEIVQSSGLFEDQKHFVDMAMTSDVETIVADFRKMKNKDRETVKSLVEKHFSEVILEEYEPLADYAESLPEEFLVRIKSVDFKNFAQDIHRLWPSLIKKIPESVYENNTTSYILPKQNMLLVPGGRFHWDSYWTILGLYRSGMPITAKTAIENMLDYVDRFGFVPNANRIYYLDRSQPPMLAFMVDLHYRKTRDTVFLKHALPLLKREYAFWMRPGRRAVELRHMGKTYLLNRYFSARASERPESWLADRAASAGMRPEARRRFFAHVAAAAESGWDFSSRWLGADGALRGLLTTEVLPADLNALLLGVERLLAGYCKVFNDGSFRLYLKNYKRRMKAMYDVFYNARRGQWFDYHLEKGERGQIVAASNFIPLWTRAYETSGPRRVDIRRVIKTFENSHLNSGEIPMAVSDIASEQQWDFPNAWSPISHMLITGFEKTDTAEGRRLAQSLAERLLYEKINTQTDQALAGTGEYEGQVGFGWTNGSMLDILYRYGMHF